MLCCPAILGTSTSWPIPSSPWHGAHTAVTAGAAGDCATASRGYTIAQIAILQLRSVHLESDVIGNRLSHVHVPKIWADNQLMTACVFTAHSHQSRHKGGEGPVPQRRSSPKWRGSRWLSCASLRTPPERDDQTHSRPSRPGKTYANKI
jgi:hypothetical protein